jgi:hypothetical protein
MSETSEGHGFEPRSRHHTDDLVVERVSSLLALPNPS